MPNNKPKYNDRQINVRLPADLAAKAQAKANQQKRPLSEVLRDLLRTWISKPPK
jgi:hypothetical protein